MAGAAQLTQRGQPEPAAQAVEAGAAAPHQAPQAKAATVDLVRNGTQPTDRERVVEVAEAVQTAQPVLGVTAVCTEAREAAAVTGPQQRAQTEARERQVY